MRLLALVITLALLLHDSTGREIDRNTVWPGETVTLQADRDAQAVKITGFNL